MNRGPDSSYSSQTDTLRHVKCNTLPINAVIQGLIEGNRQRGRKCTAMFKRQQQAQYWTVLVNFRQSATQSWDLDVNVTDAFREYGGGVLRSVKNR